MKFTIIAFCFLLIAIKSYSDTTSAAKELKRELVDISEQIESLNKPKKTVSLQNSPKSLQEKLNEVRIELRDITSDFIRLKEKSVSGSNQAFEVYQETNSINADSMESPPQTLPSVNLDAQQGEDATISSGMEIPILKKRVSSSNYLIFSQNVHFSNNLDFSFPGGTTGEIYTDGGYGISLEIGRNFGLLELGFLIGYDRTRFEKVSLTATSYYGSGQSTVYKLAVHPAVHLEIGDLTSFRIGAGLGFGKRHDNFDFDIGSTQIYQEDLSFLFNLYGSLGVKMSDYSSIFLGYRFSYLGESERFGDYGTHGIEIGGRFGF